MPERVFVQIPAYRDRELLRTVQDLLRTAAYPQHLRIAIAWQHDDTEEGLEEALRRCGNVELLKIRAADSLGCNWARSLLQKRWNGERYTLLLDSHHRFAPRWDEHVIALYEECQRAGIAKPIITGYLPPYDPRNDPHGRTQTVLRMDVLERQDGMVFRLTGHSIPQWTQLTAPVAARFASLHFLFADGTFNSEIPFDPSVYFFADEVAIALRAYTFGYDLFHPHRILAWHLYDRATRVTHWADHSGWAMQNEASCRRLRELFRGALRGKYGLGPARTISDYEAFIGAPLIKGVCWRQKGGGMNVPPGQTGIGGSKEMSTPPFGVSWMDSWVAHWVYSENVRTMEGRDKAVADVLKSLMDLKFNERLAEIRRFIRDHPHIDEPPDGGPPEPGPPSPSGPASFATTFTDEPPDGGTPEPGVPPTGPEAGFLRENPWILYWFISIKAPMLLDVIDAHMTRRLGELRAASR